MTKNLKSKIEMFLTHELYNNKNILMVDGKWGIGKTHAIKDCFEDNDYEYKVCYTSLFGYDNLKDFTSEIAMMLYPVKSSILKLVNKGMSFITILNGVANKDFSFLEEPNPEIELKIKENLRNKTLLIIDDLERKSSKLEWEVLLALFEKLTNVGYKLILVCNSDEIRPNSQGHNIFFNFKEKVVSETYKFSNSKEVFDKYLNKYNLENYQIYDELNGNLRHFFRVLSFYKYLKEKVDPTAFDHYKEDIFKSCAAIIFLNETKNTNDYDEILKYIREKNGTFISQLVNEQILYIVFNAFNNHEMLDEIKVCYESHISNLQLDELLKPLFFYSSQDVEEKLQQQYNLILDNKISGSFNIKHIILNWFECGFDPIAKIDKNKLMDYFYKNKISLSKYPDHMHQYNKFVKSYLDYKKNKDEQIILNEFNYNSSIEIIELIECYQDFFKNEKILEKIYDRINLSALSNTINKDVWTDTHQLIECVCKLGKTNSLYLKLYDNIKKEIKNNEFDNMYVCKLIVLKEKMEKW
ncbi:MAG: P-loop NTPase fold protein [Mycoplasma sp.]